MSDETNAQKNDERRKKAIKWAIIIVVLDVIVLFLGT